MTFEKIGTVLYNQKTEKLGVSKEVTDKFI
jgi:hypothetical protein